MHPSTRQEIVRVGGSLALGGGSFIAFFNAIRWLFDIESAVTFLERLTILNNPLFPIALIVAGLWIIWYAENRLRAEPVVVDAYRQPYRKPWKSTAKLACAVVVVSLIVATVALISLHWWRRSPVSLPDQVVAAPVEPPVDVTTVVDRFPLPPIVPALEQSGVEHPIVPATDPSSPIPFDPRPSINQARIDVTVVTLDRMQPNPVFAFQFANTGGLTAEGFVRAILYASSTRPLSDQQIGAYQDEAEEAADFFARPDMEKSGQTLPYTEKPVWHKLFSPGRRMVPGDPSDHTADWLRQEVPQVLNHRKRLYFFVAIKYRDKTMPANVLGLSETCGYFASTFEVQHQCGRRRAILMETFRRTSR